jgi:hypothetical protein
MKPIFLAFFCCHEIATAVHVGGSSQGCIKKQSQGLRGLGRALVDCEFSWGDKELRASKLVFSGSIKMHHDVIKNLFYEHQLLRRKSSLKLCFGYFKFYE